MESGERGRPVAGVSSGVYGNRNYVDVRSLMIKLARSYINCHMLLCYTPHTRATPER